MKATKAKRKGAVRFHFANIFWLCQLSNEKLLLCC